MYLYSDEPTQLHRVLKTRMQYRYSKIHLVSPFFEPAYLTYKHPFGRFLFKARDDATDVLIIVREMDQAHIGIFEELVRAGIRCFFYKRLHSKLYVFETNTTMQTKWSRTDSLAILGSANMTRRGWNLDGGLGNEELSLKMDGPLLQRAITYTNTLTRKCKTFEMERREALKSMRPMGEDYGY